MNRWFDRRRPDAPASWGRRQRWRRLLLLKILRLRLLPRCPMLLLSGRRREQDVRWLRPPGAFGARYQHRHDERPREAGSADSAPINSCTPAPRARDDRRAVPERGDPRAWLFANLDSAMALLRMRPLAGRDYRGPLAICCAAALQGCGLQPPLRIMTCETSPAAPIMLAENGDEATTTLSVLTYNLEGLGWPARKSRSSELREIGERLAAMRSAGSAPDVVLFQEMFSSAAKRAVAASGYPAIVSGPGRTTAPYITDRAKLAGRARPLKGELGIKLIGGGLAIASKYPIIDTAVDAYGRRACAGLDCLSNKGLLLARIAIPGVPAPIDIVNTHMNSRGASGVSAARDGEAHARQTLAASEFIAREQNLVAPLIFGGDFNMRHSEDRWAAFSASHPLDLVHEVCVDPASGCDVNLSWDGDAPWMDTQDLQFFAGGETLNVRPIRAAALFDGGESGPRLSDHDGFLVTYELRWPTGVRHVRACKN